MKTEITETVGIGRRFSVVLDNVEVAHAYLYLLTNDLHREPFGLLEDVFVGPDMRGLGIGTKLLKLVVASAKDEGCYKLIATSRLERNKVHKLYQSLGFSEHGKEFRIDF